MVSVSRVMLLKLARIVIEVYSPIGLVAPNAVVVSNAVATVKIRSMIRRGLSNRQIRWKQNRRDNYGKSFGINACRSCDYRVWSR